MTCDQGRNFPKKLGLQSNILGHSYHATPIGLMLIFLDVGVVATTPLNTKVTPMPVIRSFDSRIGKKG